MEVADRELIRRQLDYQQAQGQADGQPEEVDRRVAALSPQVAEGGGQIIGQHADPFLGMIRFRAYSVRSVSTGLARAARIAWWPTVRPATRKERAPETTKTPGTHLHSIGEVVEPLVAQPPGDGDAEDGGDGHGPGEVAQHHGG